jgi:hypothetical protein
MGAECSEEREERSLSLLMAELLKGKMGRGRKKKPDARPPRGWIVF